MDSNDELQTRLDRIGQWELFNIDWAHVRDLAALSLVDLCALSVGIHPEYARLVRGMTTIDPDDIPKPEEIAELAAYQNEAVTKWEQRVGVALNHVAVGTLPIVRTAARLGEHDPYEAMSEDVEKIAVKVADFVAWADGMGWNLHPEFPRAQADAVAYRWPWGNYETKLLRLMAEAIKKFWTYYDPTDKTTAPTNAQVFEWLQKQGVSGPIAGAIATIIRANGLPSGRRKS